MIARAADFHGPETPNGLPNALVFGPLAKNQKASWLANDSVPHSYTYTPDAARSLVMLAESESAWNQTWHVATSRNPPTGKEFIAMAAKELGVAPRYRVLSRPMVRLIGWFNPLVGEAYEMLYQNDSPYLFDSSKFERAFSFSGTPYAEGIRATAASFQKTQESRSRDSGAPAVERLYRRKPRAKVITPCKRPFVPVKLGPSKPTAEFFVAFETRDGKMISFSHAFRVTNP